LGSRKLQIAATPAAFAAGFGGLRAHLQFNQMSALRHNDAPNREFKAENRFA
jgi:hypothetical protein